MALVSILVSIFALAFTLMAFWWIHARKGQLVVAQPFTWSGYSREDGDIRLRFPLVLANSGPVGIVVEDLRATITSQGLNAHLPWCTERDRLRPESDEENDFAAALIVKGRDVARHFVEFGGQGADPAALIPGAEYDVAIEGLVVWASFRVRRPKWVMLTTTRIDGPPAGSRNRYITYQSTDRRRGHEVVTVDP